MSHLRRKLEIGGASPGTISSIPAVGYVFRRTPTPAAEPAAFPATSVAQLSVAGREAGSAA